MDTLKNTLKPACKAYEEALINYKKNNIEIYNSEIQEIKLTIEKAIKDGLMEAGFLKWFLPEVEDHLQKMGYVVEKTNLREYYMKQGMSYDQYIDKIKKCHKGINTHTLIKWHKKPIAF